MGRLDNKVALVTGGARGMGAAEARRFAAEGAAVAITDVLVEEGKQMAAAIDGAPGGAAVFFEHDVTSAQDWDRVVADTVAAFGRLDIVVNNAGIFWVKPIAETSEDDFMGMVRVNQLGVFLGIKATTDALTASGGGSIINISSIAGLRGSAGSAAYTATKFAVRGMTKVAALELVPNKIRVNSIHPGLIDTNMMDTMVGGMDELKPMIGQRVPNGVLATADQVANMALFLASDESDYCTGAEFVVDGGITAGMHMVTPE